MRLRLGEGQNDPGRQRVWGVGISSDEGDLFSIGSKKIVPTHLRWTYFSMPISHLDWDGFSVLQVAS